MTYTSYEKNVYSNPEATGLKFVGQVDFSDGCYNFDYSAVWQKVETGELLYGEDSGCSCPSPFEYTPADELLPLKNVQQLGEILQGRKSNSYNYERDYEKERIDAECVALLSRVANLKGGA